MRMRLSCATLAVATLGLLTGQVDAGNNELTVEERRDGWRLLFDGKTLDGWMTSSQQPSRRPVEDGALNPHRCGGYMLVHRQMWSDFILSLDFKISPKCNSGIFLRTYSLQPRPGKDVGFNGIEVAVDDTTGAGVHDTGAIYDLVAPRKNVMRPAGEWNHAVLTCHGSLIRVELNGEEVSRIDLDQWTAPYKRPDGSSHKFDIAFKDHPRRGYLGLQDHGADCWYKNIKLKPLFTSGATAESALSLNLRSQFENPAGSRTFERFSRSERWPAEKTALIVCDVWDLHHCRNAVRRLEEFLPRLNAVVGEARRRGCVIIHAPSDCMEAYADHPARQRALQTPRAGHPPEEVATWCSRIPSEERAAYPIDQSDGGEDDDPAEHAEWAAHLKSLGRNPGMPWKRQSDGIIIDSQSDYISDRGDEVWNILEHRGIENVILTGVHTNMCVLGRPFGLRRMVHGGKNVVLMRDMTDTMYNPQRWPYVDHFTGTDLVVSHVERYVCPTITSDQLLGGEPFRFRNDRREQRDVADLRAAVRLNRETFARQWSVRSLPSDWQTATQGVLSEYGGVAWYRCAVRLPKVPTEPGGLRLLVPTASRAVRVWCNGQEVPPKETMLERAASYPIPAGAFVAQDANLIVLRVEHPAGPKGLPSAPVVIAGNDHWELKGRWQFRLGDDPDWANMPLPAKFGIGTDFFFD